MEHAALLGTRESSAQSTPTGYAKNRNMFDERESGMEMPHAVRGVVDSSGHGNGYASHPSHPNRRSSAAHPSEMGLDALEGQANGEDESYGGADVA